jgi:hypothetical protein
LQTPCASQQPVHVVEQIPPSIVGTLQDLTGSVGRRGSGPHWAPGVLHSADDVQSWTGPRGVIGHGPDVQAVDNDIVPQHT